jgi:pilus assembly protein Flp/PilA
MTSFREFLNNENGATAIEYGLIAALIGVGIILSLGNLRDSYSGLYNKIYNGLGST